MGIFRLSYENLVTWGISRLAYENLVTWGVCVIYLFVCVCVCVGGGGGNPVSGLVLVKVGLDKEALFNVAYLKQTT